MNTRRSPAGDLRVFIPMYFYSGAPMHFLSGVDSAFM
jgi:hypothetical protein